MIEDHSRHIVRQFFQPSAISGFFTILSGFISSGLALYFFIIKQSDFSGYYEQLFTVSVDRSDQIVILTNEINSSPIAADSAVFMFWAIIGMMLYVVGEIIYKITRDGRSFFDEMNHTLPEKRSTLFAIALQHVFVRLLGIVGVYGIYVFLLKALPMIVLNIYQLSDQNQIVPALVLLSFAFITGSALVYGLTLCARLVLYRLRVFGIFYR